MGRAAPAFVLLIGLGAACGGGKPAGASDSEPSPSATNPPPDPPRAPDASVPPLADGGAPTDAGGARSDAASTLDSGLPQKPGTVGGGGTPPRPTLLCTRQFLGLNVGRMVPTRAAAPAFTAAWQSELAASAAPPLVLRLEQLNVGPVSATLGAVRISSATTWAFEAPPLTAQHLFVQVDPAMNRHVSIPPTKLAAVASFGDATGRRGFTISKFMLDGYLTPQCDALVGSTTMFIPSSNAAQPFGGATVGQLLGPANVDTDGDATPDAWVVDFAGTASLVQVSSGP